ncbi:hypothetical protein GPECTOR_31g290 [Gonium pectorale]|uniref:CUB domain-containing protein n=1 Tax=Gonium pectorale TaxID=33097 RepID=A0A150GDN9_GONPE|nr:hypothetical protein GPECTOR_31g290 [Gonium pectorale]|eukprot:KXZ47928.1 hypothetical protein GPECTOR_31g290 [Gonium pectorale]
MIRIRYMEIDPLSDTLEVADDATGTAIATFRGRIQSPKDVAVKGSHSFTVRFTSDGVVRNGGFLLEYWVLNSTSMASLLAQQREASQVAPRLNMSTVQSVLADPRSGDLCDPVLVVHGPTYYTSTSSDSGAAYITNDLRSRLAAANVTQSDGRSSPLRLPPLPTSDPASWLKPYAPRTNCSWVLLLPASAVLSVAVRFMDLEQPYDRLVITDALSSAELASYSGAASPESGPLQPLEWRGLRAVRLQFTSDGFQERRGFVLEFKDVAAGGGTDTNGSVCQAAGQQSVAQLQLNVLGSEPDVTLSGPSGDVDAAAGITFTALGSLLPPRQTADGGDNGTLGLPLRFEWTCIRPDNLDQPCFAAGNNNPEQAEATAQQDGTTTMTWSIPAGALAANDWHVFSATVTQQIDVVAGFVAPSRTASLSVSLTRLCPIRDNGCDALHNADQTLFLQLQVNTPEWQQQGAVVEGVRWNCRDLPGVELLPSSSFAAGEHHLAIPASLLAVAPGNQLHITAALLLVDDDRVLGAGGGNTYNHTSSIVVQLNAPPQCSAAAAGSTDYYSLLTTTSAGRAPGARDVSATTTSGSCLAFLEAHRGNGNGTSDDDGWAVMAHLDGFSDAEDRTDLCYEFEAWQDYFPPAGGGGGGSHIFVSGDSPSAFLAGFQPGAPVGVVACAVDIQGARTCSSGSITFTDGAADPYTGNFSAVQDALMAIDMQTTMRAGAGAQLLLLQSSQAAFLSRRLLTAAAASSGDGSPAADDNAAALSAHMASMIEILAQELHKYDDMSMVRRNCV